METKRISPNTVRADLEVFSICNRKPDDRDNEFYYERSKCPPLN